MATSLILFLLDPPTEEAGPLPADTARLAERLATHPMDWQAARALADQALDENDPARVVRWRSAQALTTVLAPHYTPARIGYVRAGLFHWYELQDADRHAVLAALAPMLRDPVTFERMVKPIFELTGDMTFLRAAQPHTIHSIETLMEIAAMNGRFDDYRALRNELVATRTHELSQKIDSLAPSQIIAALPLHPTKDEEPMLLQALRALHERPLEVDGGHADVLDATIDYATRHRLTPIDGLAAVVRERTWADAFSRHELALALGNASAAENITRQAGRPAYLETSMINGVSWDGACGPAFCNRATADINGSRSITIEGVGGDEVPPYFECYVDEVLQWEGAVPSKKTITLGGPGQHRIEVRLVNPRTKNPGGRRFRIS
jgi:hypothetical protein